MQDTPDMMAQLTDIISSVSNFVWGPPMLILLVGTGVYLTIVLRGLQFRTLIPSLHLALIERCRERAAEGDSVAVVTFEPLPQTFFRPENSPARLTTVYQKLFHLKNAGVDLVWLMRFGQLLASQPAREFVEKALLSGLGAKCVVIGEDFHFGLAVQR